MIPIHMQAQLRLVPSFQGTQVRHLRIESKRLSHLGCLFDLIVHVVIRVLCYLSSALDAPQFGPGTQPVSIVNIVHGPHSALTALTALTKQLPTI
jgi:hypothetical protein